MAPTNNKTVHQTSFTQYREQPRSTLIVVAYPRPAFSATNRTNTFQPVLINNSKFLMATHRTKKRKIEIPRSMVVEALSWWKPAREPASSRPKPCASLKKPHESCPFAAPCGPRRKKNDRGQRSAFPSETSRFALSILAYRGSALPWRVTQRSSCPSPSPNLVRTHLIENYQALRDSAPCLSRAATLPKATKLELGRGAHLKTPSSANHTAAASQPTGRIWHVKHLSPS